jgi:hypothetical protein
MATSNDTNTKDDNQVNLEDDEEELRRLENIENSYIPFTISNQNNEKEKEEINIEQLKYMQRLLNNKTTFLSDDVAKNFKDLWSKSIDKEQRQALYRYWLWKYVQLLIGITHDFLRKYSFVFSCLEEIFLSNFFFLIDEWFRLNEQYDETHQSMQELWLANDRLYMEKAFM